MIRIASELEYAYIALSNALNNPALQRPLADYGYPPQRLHQGMALYQEARDRLGQMMLARQARVAATQEFYKAWRTARRLYSRDLASARAYLSDRPELHVYLQLTGKRDSTFAGWHGQARTLYQGIQADPELQALLAPIGVTPERVTLGLQALAVASDALVRQSDHKGRARGTAQQYASVRKRLNDWIDLFGISARRALTTEPELLISLGLDRTLGQKRRRKLALKRKHVGKGRGE